LNTVRHQHIR